MARKVGNGQFLVSFLEIFGVTATDVVRKKWSFGQFLAILVSFEKQKWAEKLGKNGLKRGFFGLKWAFLGLFWVFFAIF